MRICRKLPFATVGGAARESGESGHHARARAVQYANFWYWDTGKTRYSIGFSLLSAPSPFSLCTLHFHFHFVLGFSIPGKHKRKFDETGVDDIESSQEVVVDEYGTPLCFLAKKGFKKK